MKHSAADLCCQICLVNLWLLNTLPELFCKVNWLGWTVLESSVYVFLGKLESGIQIRQRMSLPCGGSGADSQTRPAATSPGSQLIVDTL